MPAVTIRNLPEETHRALKVKAGRHGRSIAAEIREILDAAVRPAERVKLGSLLASARQDFPMGMWTVCKASVTKHLLSQ